MNLVIGFDDPRADAIDTSGGKGASLARAARELPVPDGVIVASDAYRRFMAPLSGAVAAALDESGDDAATAAARVRDLVLAAPLPEGLAAELEAALQARGLLRGHVAVRSSGTLEDLPGAAFAGQHDTFLGLRGIDAVCDALRRCYASLWNPHVMLYRRRLGLDHTAAAMAVVVQAMVDVRADEAAGVAFSIDPVRGDLSQVLVNAAFGLGETVVAGESPVDEYRLPREGDAPGEESIADKPQALVADGDGVAAVALDAAHAKRPALDAAQRREVARLALAAEHHFGFPQDIEWAFHDGRLFLLQSRPVTRIPARWTRDESAERFPNPVTPLTWDLCEAGFHASLNYSFRLMGLPPFGEKWFAMHDYNIYGNQNAVELYSGRLPVKMLKDVDSIRAALPQIARQFAWVQELPVTWMRDLDTYLIGIGALAHERLDDKSLPQLWDYVLRINALGAEYFLPNIAISLTQRTLYAGLQQMLRLALPADRAQAVFDALLAQTDTKTGQINAELWQLSRLLRRDPALQQALRDGDAKQALAALPAHPAFEREFNAFLQRHGHRELDFDAYQPTWCEAPHIVLEQIKLMAARSDEDHAAQDNTRRMEQAGVEHAVLSQAPDELRYLVQEVIRLARAYTALDDLEHYQTTRLTPPLRRGLRAVGERLVALGALDEAMDVFFVPFDELDAALTAEVVPAGQVLETARRHKAGYQAALAGAPQWNLGEDATAPTEGDGVLRGLAGSPGTVEGEAFVVRSPEDFPKFPPGAILIARTTSPAWTALFYQATGVITESGGPLSHGAVTARELGIPAVMSVRDAMERITSGRRVRIDGRNGTVEVLED